MLIFDVFSSVYDMVVYRSLKNQRNVALRQAVGVGFIAIGLGIVADVLWGVLRTDFSDRIL
ncbi:MAG: hypothetical protein OCC49_14065 [Fibrobacterales bacterium]